MHHRLAACVALIAMTACTSEPATTREGTRSGTAVVAVGTIGELDPPRAGWEGLRIITTACDGLTRLDQNGPAPALASRWTMSEDAKTFRFSLRRSKFQDGTAVRAADVAESLSRVVRPETGGRWAHLLELVEGAPQVASGEARHLPGVSSVDDRTIQIRTVSAYPELPNVLAHPALVITKEEPRSCSGPYVVNVEGEAVVLTASETSVGPDGGKLERIEYRVAADAAVRELGMGEPVPDGHGLISAVSDEIEFLHLVGDPLSFNARHAISSAIGRLVITDAAFGESSTPALGWRPRSDDAGRACGAVGLVADADKASRLWSTTELGPIRIPFRYVDRAGAQRVVQALELQLMDRLGIEIEEIGMSDASFAEADKGQPGIWLMTRTRTLATPALSLRDLSVRPEVQEVLAQARGTLDQQERFEVYDRAEAMICEEMFKAPLWAKVDRWSYSTSDIGFPPDVALDPTGSPPMRKAYLR